ncbi:MAG TPA: hypothetical protein VME92_21200 [Acetobacteraceae bacterium]|nr:hypothetical protein [Acetobacteraceae bacterium]
MTQIKFCRGRCVLMPGSLKTMCRGENAMIAAGGTADGGTHGLKTESQATIARRDQAILV